MASQSFVGKLDTETLGLWLLIGRVTTSQYPRRLFAPVDSHLLLRDKNPALRTYKCAISRLLSYEDAVAERIWQNNGCIASRLRPTLTAGLLPPSICKQDKSGDFSPARNGFRSLSPCTTLAWMDCFFLLSVLPQFLLYDESNKRPVWCSLREEFHGVYFGESTHNSPLAVFLERDTRTLWVREQDSNL